MIVLSDFQGVAEGISKSRINIRIGNDVAISCGYYLLSLYAPLHVYFRFVQRGTIRQVGARAVSLFA